MDGTVGCQGIELTPGPLFITLRATLEAFLSSCVQESIAMSSTSKREWSEKTLGPLKERYGERRESFETDSGLSIETTYTPEDIGDLDYSEKLGYPGEYPYTRGVQPNMYRGRIWTMRQYSGFASPEESNRRYRYLLDEGQTGLSVAFDLPTQTGYDSDHPLALGEVGMEAIYTGVRQTPEMIVEVALQENVDVIGLSILSGAHRRDCRFHPRGRSRPGRASVRLLERYRRNRRGLQPTYQ